jgi:hypothetical protein
LFCFIVISSKSSAQRILPTNQKPPKPKTAKNSLYRLANTSYFQPIELQMIKVYRF